MKSYTNCILIASMLVAFSSLRAQIIPGSAFPVAGDNFSLIEADTAGVLPGAGGAGVTWNFGTLATSFGSQLDSFMAPSATPYGALFPTATIALHEVVPIAGTNYYIYYINNTVMSTYERIANVQPDTVIYTTPAGEYPYPVTSTTTFSGNYYAHYNTSGGSATEAGVGSGATDGTGTLILPTGTYTNVLRVHSNRTEQDTVYTSSTDAAQQVDEYYEWYQSNSYYPILSIHYTTLSVMGFTVLNQKAVAYRAGYASSGINDISAGANGLMSFPNPANDKVSVVYNMATAGETEINIYDLTGRLLQSNIHASAVGMQSVSIDIAQLPPGMYEIKMTNAQSAGAVKLQIVK
jgi:hypothetical protein